jgi:hypothetical protein
MGDDHTSASEVSLDSFVLKSFRLQQAHVDLRQRNLTGQCASRDCGNSASNIHLDLPHPREICNPQENHLESRELALAVR